MSDPAPAPPKSPKKASVKKVVNPKKLAKPADHPAFKEMVKVAIAALKERGGSSRQKILKYIQGNFKVKDNARLQVNKALKKGDADGTFVKVKGSFKLSDAAKKPPKKEVKKKPVAKKPAAKKAGGRKPAAKKGAKAAAKKVAGKKPAKKGAKKPVAKKPAAKKPAAKKPAAKAKSGKKTVAKKGAKKPTAKKGAKKPKAKK